MHETLQHSDLEPVSCSNAELIQDAVRDIDAAPPNLSGARELRDILTDPNFCVRLNEQYTVWPRYNAVFRVHGIEPRYKRVTL